MFSYPDLRQDFDPKLEESLSETDETTEAVTSTEPTTEATTSAATTEATTSATTSSSTSEQGSLESVYINNVEPVLDQEPEDQGPDAESAKVNGLIWAAKDSDGGSVFVPKADAPYDYLMDAQHNMHEDRVLEAGQVILESDVDSESETKVESETVKSETVVVLETVVESEIVDSEYNSVETEEESYVIQHDSTSAAPPLDSKKTVSESPTSTVDEDPQGEF